jgi:hypothetical protein
MEVPMWKRIVDELSGRLLTAADPVLKRKESPNLNVSVIPHLALYHLLACLNASIEANARAQPSCAISLIRQCVGALTIIDLGLQESGYRDPILDQWHAGRRTTGEIRKLLAQAIWSRYGTGLWDESWGTYFSNLAKAVHPYAHYSPELMGWQMTILHYDGGNSLVIGTGPESADPVKAGRLALFQALIIWTLGRILLANTDEPEVQAFRESIERLRLEIGSSKLLFKSKNWTDELMPHVAFYPGVEWRDE